MATYFPPTEDLPIFDSAVFAEPNNASLTAAQANALYLKRTGVASSVATSTIFTGNVTAPNFLGNASSSTLSATSTIANDTSNAVFYPTFVSGTGTQALKIDTTSPAFSINPSSGAFNLSNTMKMGTSIGLGTNAGLTNQGADAVALGISAATTNQSAKAVAIGTSAGTTTQGADAVAIGTSAGTTTQGANSIAIGLDAGKTSQSASSIAIGAGAGTISQSGSSVAIGVSAGNSNQQASTVAIGAGAGQTTQSTNSVAIGTNAGQSTQQASAVAIGNSAGKLSQGSGSVAIGFNAGQGTSSGQGANAIAIGNNAGTASQTAGSICLNASGVALNPNQVGCFVNPVRNEPSITGSFNSVFYNPTTFELVNGTASTPTLSQVLVSGNSAGATSIDMNGNQITNCNAVSSINSGASGFSLSNSASNTGPIVIQNSQTNTNIFYRQAGITQAHIFQTNGSTITNLTLSSIANTSNLPFTATFPSAGAATKTLNVIDSTTTRSLAVVPSATGANLNPLVGAGDTQIVASGPTIGTATLIISPWSANSVGIRMNTVNLLLGAGGTTSTPSSSIIFNSPANGATVNGNMSFDGDILPRATYTAKTSSMLGYSATFNATNTGALTSGTVFNNIAAGFFLNLGVYFFSITVYLNKTVSGGNITLIETGISLLTGSFSGGYTAYVAGQQTYAGAGTDAIVHNVTFTLPVQINTTLYFLTRATHTLTNLNNTVNSYIQVTRVA